MAKLHEEIIVVKLSKLVRDSEQAVPMLSQDIKANLEAVVQELAGQHVLVEIATE